MGLRPTLVIFAKQPVMGRVKTRLAAEVGWAAATRFYRRNLADVCRRLSGDRRWRTLAAVTPDGARVHETHGIAHIDQGPGDLGARMQRVFDTLTPGPVVIVGSDIPGIERTDIAGAFGALVTSDAVMGPSDDGGYWLIGLRRRPFIPRVFEDVRWSAAETGRDTLARLADQGASVAFVRELNDVDTAADYFSVNLGISSTKLQGL